MQKEGRWNSSHLTKDFLLFVIFGISCFNPILSVAQGAQVSGLSSRSSEVSEKNRSAQISYETYVMCRS
ncbi:MAG: hypothetical protein WCH11_06580, partial [Bdellovibrio sp.]